MNKYYYKEKTYAEDMLKNGFITNNINFELRILVKYYKELGHTPKEREELIYKFCEEHYEGFNKVTHFKMINSVLNYGRKKENKLIEIDNIHITKEELNFIDEINLEHNHKKVVFTLLVLDRLNKKVQEIKNEGRVNKEHYYGGSEKHYRELKRLSKIPVNRSKKNKSIHELIRDLVSEGIVEATTRGYIKLLFIYDLQESDNLVLKIDKFENIGYYYDYYIGENKVKPCECCGVMMRANIGTKKYCQICANEKERIRKREWKRINLQTSSEKLNPPTP